MVIKRHALTVLFWLLPAVAMAESYLCVSDMAAGFTYDSQLRTWSKANFRAESKYIVSRPNIQTDVGKWEVKEIGSIVPTAFCRDEFTKYGGLNCTGMFEFRMNKKTLRFIAAYLVGCWTDNLPDNPTAFVEGQNTPYLEIGKCSPL